MVRVVIQEVREGAVKLLSALGRIGETFTQREYLQHYGFTSRPLPGAEGVVVERGNLVLMIASDDRRYRVAVSEGEVCLYTDEGDKVHLKRGREIEVVGGEKVTVTTKVAQVVAATKVVLDAPLVEATGNLTVAGEITDILGSMNEMRSIYNGHTHPNDGVPTPSMV